MIHLTVPSLPPSMNNAYVTIRGGRRMLSTAGKRYKNETKTFIAQKYPSALLFFRKNEPYSLVVEFVFAEEVVYCKTWPEEAESRYKKLDVTNRAKLFEDALSEATGLDDQQNFTVTLVKSVGPEEITRLWAWNREREECPIDGFLRQLKS